MNKCEAIEALTAVIQAVSRMPENVCILGINVDKVATVHVNPSSFRLMFAGQCCKLERDGCWTQLTCLWADVKVLTCERDDAGEEATEIVLPAVDG